MPLTEIQRSVVAVLRPFRSAHDYVGGGATLNREWPRLSDDMDIFHDRRGRLPRGVDRELDALRDNGYSVEVTASADSTVEVIVGKFGFETKVQWLDDEESCRRFFPAVDDGELGFRLHQADVAVNKVLCASRRNRAVRDAVDLVNIVERYCPLGPLVWAAVGKDNRTNPLRMIQDIRRNAFGYSDAEIRTVRMEGGVGLSRAALRATLEPALSSAEDYCERSAPDEHLGYLFVNAQEVPVSADLTTIARGDARVIPIQDFSAIPNIV